MKRKKAKGFTLKKIFTLNVTFLSIELLSNQERNLIHKKRCNKMKKLFVLIAIVGLLGSANAQVISGGYMDPDSLVEITVTGVIHINSDYDQPHYFLDVDNDNVDDYFLNFGPYWYEPDSSDAVRPIEGEEVTVFGGTHDIADKDYAVLVVYEINDQFWRDPFYAYWNNFDGHGSGSHTGKGCGNYSFGWNYDSLETVTVTGTTLIDSTFAVLHYFLDVDADSQLDYFLNFGPYWYEPESGALRPSDGEEITIEGGLIEAENYNIIVVYTLNGIDWRDSSNFSGGIGGGWIEKDMSASLKFNNPFDDDDNFTINPGWHGNHMGGMMQDSLYCQFLELYPDNIPNAENKKAMMGYEFGVFNTNGTNMLNTAMGEGKMKFANNNRYKFHYNDIQLEGNNMNENTLRVEYWDSEQNDWVQVSGVTIDTETNTIEYVSPDVVNYVIITGDNLTSVYSEETAIPNAFSLKQNYPNPFNPTTTIEFSLNETNPVELTIYDVLGNRITTIVNQTLESGVYNFQFDASGLSSGIYFYQLKAGQFSAVKKMNLIK